MLIDYQKANVYQADDSVLNDVNFQVDADQFVYVIGKVGSGKSSLLKTIYCEVDFDKDDAEMGIIFQDFQLLHDRNVYRNLEFVLHSTGWKSSKQIAERIEQVLEAVGMQDMKLRLPHELSGGEQQRIAIARALLNSPKIIIADEPTGNLDPETAEKIVGLLYEISHTGTAVVFSTHNHGLIEKFPGRVFECEQGKLHDVTDRYNK